MSSVTSVGVRGDASVGFHTPLAVLPTKSVGIGRTTGPLTPGAPLWKCAAVIAPGRPSTVTLKTRPLGERANDPVPRPPTASGGVVFCPGTPSVRAGRGGGG